MSQLFSFYLLFLLNYYAVKTDKMKCDSNTNKCYLFVHSPLSFAEADRNCSRSGGHLTSIENVFENQFIQNQAQTEFGKYSSFWIGGTYTNGGKWTWKDGSDFKFTNWAPGSPGAPTAYVAIDFQTPNGLWTVSLDVNSNPFVCSVPELTTTTAFSTTIDLCRPIAVCDSGWTNLNEFCYKVFPLNKNFTEAEAYCQQNNGHLVSVHSDEENDFITELSARGVEGRFSHAQTYIGLSKVNGTWTWTDNSTFGYTLWAPNQPDNQDADQNCGQVFPDGAGTDYPPGKWDDLNCELTLMNFVCKKNANH